MRHRGREAAGRQALDRVVPVTPMPYPRRSRSVAPCRGFVRTARRRWWQETLPGRVALGRVVWVDTGLAIARRERWPGDAARSI